MTKAKQIESLANRIAVFFGTTPSKMVASLWDTQRRKGIAADLKGTAEYCENDSKAYEASMLWREVMAL